MPLAAAVLLFGCVSQFVEPTKGSRATIEFVNESPSMVVMNMYKNAKGCRDRSSLSIAAFMRKDVVIPANGEFAMTAIGVNGSEVCLDTVDFPVSEGKKYLYFFRREGERCLTLLTEAVTIDGKVQPGDPVPVIRRTFERAPLSEAGPWCDE